MIHLLPCVRHSLSGSVLLWHILCLVSVPLLLRVDRVVDGVATEAPQVRPDRVDGRQFSATLTEHLRRVSHACHNAKEPMHSNITFIFNSSYKGPLKWGTDCKYIEWAY